MRVRLLFLFLVFGGTPFAISGPTGILSSAKPENGETLIKTILHHEHANHLFSQVSIIKDGQGRTLLRVFHSNGTRGDHTIQFVVQCNVSGKTGKDHQYIGHSYHGAVERVQYYLIDCSERNIGIKFMSKEVWNSVDIGLKLLSGAFGSYSW